MAQALPIKFQELLQLSALGINQTAITFNTCVRCPHLALTLLVTVVAPPLVPLLT